MRRGEAGEIADDAAAKRDDEVAALEPGGEQGVDHFTQPGEGLGALAVGQHDFGVADVGCVERGGERAATGRWPPRCR